MSDTMTLADIVHRALPALPWAEGEHIPWDEPGFSARMLREHLTQSHDMASRRAPTIDRHVAWIHGALLGGKPSRVLDLGCGPGLYTSRLARLGHRCVGVDFSPASLAYAREVARTESLDCRYVHGDVRAVTLGEGFDLAMMVFGELNTLRPDDAHQLLRRVRAALTPGALLLLEPHTADAVRRLADAGQTWYASPGGLFSAAPHIVLEETFWDAAARATTTRFFVVDAATAAVERYAQTLQAYTDEEYRALLEGCGFTVRQVAPALSGDPADADDNLFAIVARAS